MKKNSIRLLFAAAAAAISLAANAGVSIAVSIAPPALPIYSQPPIPGEGYIWTPGYWSWDDGNQDYYWVPGTWVLAPYVGALWTPGYWGWFGGYYRWHGGYWGTHIGYYGGVNYGFGYTGAGYRGGYWNNGVFNYNRSVNNVTNIHNTYVYNAPVAGANPGRVSYNGGQSGVHIPPTRGEEMIAGMPHKAPTEPQMRHEFDTHGNQAQRVSVNHGMPPVAATPEPSRFNSPYVSAARAEPAQAHPYRAAPAYQNHPAPQHSGGAHESGRHR